MGSCVFGCALFGRRPSVSLDRQKSDDRNGSQKVRRFSLIQFHWHCLSKTKRSLFLFVFFLRFLPLLPLRSPSLFVLVFVLRAFSLSTSASNGVAKKKTTPSREPTKTKQKGHVNQGVGAGGVWPAIELSLTYWQAAAVSHDRPLFHYSSLITFHGSIAALISLSTPPFWGSTYGGGGVKNNLDFILGRAFASIKNHQ